MSKERQEDMKRDKWEEEGREGGRAREREREKEERERLCECK